MDTFNNGLLRITAILWLAWGLVHALAGVLTISGDTASSIVAIADAVDPGALQVQYPAALGAIINQHGFNLLWFGVVTILCAGFIWRGSVTAIFLAAIVGGLADLGYFLFLDLGGYVHFVPGTLMTLISSSAILASLLAWYRGRNPTAQVNRVDG